MYGMVTTNNIFYPLNIQQNKAIHIWYNKKNKSRSTRDNHLELNVIP